MQTTALRSFQFCPHLGLDGAGTIASNKAEVSEEHRHEDRAPEDLVDGDLAAKSEARKRFALRN